MNPLSAFGVGFAASAPIASIYVPSVAVTAWPTLWLGLILLLGGIALELHRIARR